MILLNTNVVSEPLRPSPDARVIAWIDAQPLETIFLSAITVAHSQLFFLTDYNFYPTCSNPISRTRVSLRLVNCIRACRPCPFNVSLNLNQGIIFIYICVFKIV